MRLALLLLGLRLAAQPLALLPANPHYFVYRGKPTVLVTSGEHYGAVLNGKFDCHHLGWFKPSPLGDGFS